MGLALFLPSHSWRPSSHQALRPWVHVSKPRLQKRRSLLVPGVGPSGEAAVTSFEEWDDSEVEDSPTDDSSSLLSSSSTHQSESFRVLSKKFSVRSAKQEGGDSSCIRIYVFNAYGEQAIM